MKSLPLLALLVLPCASFGQVRVSDSSDPGRDRGARRVLPKIFAGAKTIAVSVVCRYAQKSKLATDEMIETFKVCLPLSGLRYQKAETEDNPAIPTIRIMIDEPSDGGGNLTDVYVWIDENVKLLRNQQVIPSRVFDRMFRFKRDEMSGVEHYRGVSTQVFDILFSFLGK